MKMGGQRRVALLWGLVGALATLRSTNAQLRGAETGSARIQVDATGDMSWSEETATSYLTENSDKFLGQTSPSSVASTWTQVGSGGELHNWGQTYYFTPAKVVHAYTYDDIVRAVRDHATYPSPVRALGNIQTVTYLTVNQGGTVVLMRNLRGIKEFKFDERFNHQTVTVLGGTTALEMYTWLGEKGFEAGFQAEIGDATAGSLAVSQNKDSGLTPRSEMGSTYKGIVGVKYVDHDGNIKDINAKDNAEALAWFKCSDGLLGIVLEVTYKVFPQRLVSMKYYSAPTADVIANIHNLVTADKTVWMLLAADSTTVETREYAAPSVEHTPAMCRLIKEAKQLQFQRGELLFPDTLSRKVPLYYTCYRREMVVSYYNPNPGEPRQDFSWYEYPFERFEEVATAYVGFLRDFAARHNGWTVTGAGVYFVERIPEKPHGWFSMKGKGFEHRGLSFNMDPIATNPRDPFWIEFVNENTAFALAHGARLSLVQTRELTPAKYFAAPGTIPIPDTPNKRFTTPFLEGYVAK